MADTAHPDDALHALVATSGALQAIWASVHQAEAVAACIGPALPEGRERPLEHYLPQLERIDALADAVAELLGNAKRQLDHVERVVNKLVALETEQARAA